MPSPENPSHSPDNAPSNSTLFYGALVQGLLRPEVRYGNAHYLDVTLPPDDNYPGATGWVSDYEAYKMQAADDLIRQRREEWGREMFQGNTISFPLGLTPADRKAFLGAGLAYIDIQLADRPEPSTDHTASYSVMRPRDLREDFLPEYVAAAGIGSTAEEPFVLDIRRHEHIPDPFEEPHLLALYKYLQPEQA